MVTQSSNNDFALVALDKEYTTVVTMVQATPPYQARVAIHDDNFPPGKKINVKLPQLEKELILLRGFCLDYVSDIEESLDKTLLKYFSTFPDRVTYIETTLSVALNGEPLGPMINNWNFMECKKVLSEILKRDKRMGGKKGFTKLLNTAIGERNKYAHGRFFYLYPEYQPLLQWTDSSNKSKFAEVNKQRIQGFVDACLALYSWLSSLQNKIDEINKNKSGRLV